MKAAEIFAAIDLKIIQRIMSGAAIVVLLSIPIDYVCQRRLHLPETSPVASRRKSASKMNPEKFESYQNHFEKSPLFGNLAAAEVPVIKASLQELVKDYRLKGVILSQDSEAILEDAKTKTTSFVHKGQRLGDLLIQDIREGEITFSYLNEEIKLHVE